MRAIIQRVNEASVTIDKQLKSKINKGLLILVGFENEDTTEDLKWMCNKILNLRIFSDSDGKMNLSLLSVKGELLVVSQFTLYAAIKKGNRPSFIHSAKPTVAIPLYEHFLKLLRLQIEIKTGIFGADMEVGLVNDGPVSIFIDSKQKL